jgi:hypothetical protein
MWRRNLVYFFPLLNRGGFLCNLLKEPARKFSKRVVRWGDSARDPKSRT